MHTYDIYHAEWLGEFTAILIEFNDTQYHWISILIISVLQMQVWISAYRGIILTNDKLITVDKLITSTNLFVCISMAA